MREVVLGIDSSTQSCTVEVRDAATGEWLASGRAPHPTTHPPVSEQDPEAWWQALKLAISQALADLNVKVVALAVAGQCHGLVALDEHWQPIRAAKLWNDTTSGKQAAELVAQFGQAWWAEQIGLVPSSALTISKLRWLRDNEPESLDRLRHICLPHDWLTWRLCGEHVTDRSEASGTGFFSARSMAWRTDILEEVIGPMPWAQMLPRVLGPDEPAGTILPEVASELGIDAGAVVGPGGGDQHLAAQGIGLAEGDVAYSLGTSGVVITTTPHPVIDPTGGIDGVANATGGYLPLVCSLNCTKVTDTMARLLNVDHSELGRLALSVAADEERPAFAAFLDGERSPRLPWATGLIGGITTSTTREQLALAAFEGVSMGLVSGERRIATHGIPITGRTILIGGGARSEAYRQVIADLVGRSVVTVDAPEATARGAAIQAAAVQSGQTVVDVTSAWAPAPTSQTEPRAQRSMTRYQQLADLQFEGPLYH